MTKKDELLELLVSEKIISFSQLVEAKEVAETQKRSVEEVLVETGIIDIEDMARYKASVYNLQYGNLTEAKVQDEALNCIAPEVADNYKIICFEKNSEAIKIGLVEPENYKAVEVGDFLAKKEGLRAEYYIISKSSFDKTYKKYKSLSKEILNALETKAQEEEKEVERAKKNEDFEFDEVIKSAPVAKIVSVIMRHAVEGRASDIHIEPMQKETRIRYRIDGILNTSLVLPKNVHNSIIGRIKVLTNLKLDETRIPQDGRIRESINGKEIDFRVSIIPLMTEEKVVMRILDVTKGAPELEDLGYMGPGLEIIKQSIKKTDGMFLVTGPTGSGKSTTLFSILNRVNKEGINISTLEDPVEYFVKGVNQSQIRPEVGFTFAAGLRSLLRQDPDIIMVGEIRDNETAELAIHASLTGHFVLSTLHTNDAIGAVPRFLDMNVENFLLSSTLECVVAQRLARKICEFCKEEDSLAKKSIDNILEVIKNIPKELITDIVPDFDPENIKTYKGKGCSKCGNTGYTSRVAIAEVLGINDTIKNMIAEGKNNLTLEEVRKTQPFICLKEDGVMKVLKGLTSYEEVLRVFQD